MKQKFNPEKTKRLKWANAVLKIFFHEKKAAGPIPLQNARKILVIELGLIGDAVMSIPFFRALRGSAPQAEITLVCGSWAKTIFRGQGLADKYIVLDPKACSTPLEMLRNRKRIRQALHEINQASYDVALEPRGDLRYIFLMHGCNAGRKVSYSYTGGECFLTDAIRPSAKACHLVEDKLYFAKKIGCRVQKGSCWPTLKVMDAQLAVRQAMAERSASPNGADRMDAQIAARQAMAGSLGLAGKKIIGIHPGASLAVKQWDGFAELAKKLGSLSDRMAFLVFEGPGERDAARKVEDAGKECGAQVVVSRTGLAQYMQRVSMCHALICNDSGAGHLAAAYGVPVFVVFGPVEPAFAKPYAPQGVHVFSDSSLPCKPCFRAECVWDQECLKNVSVDEVFTEFQRAGI